MFYFCTYDSFFINSRMTENRVASFNHDLVPHYLRTKPEPQVENKYTGYEARANAAKDTLSKQCAVMEKVSQIRFCLDC